MDIKKVRTLESIKLIIFSTFFLTSGALFVAAGTIDGWLDTPHKIACGIAAAACIILGIAIVYSGARTIRADAKQLENVHERNLQDKFINRTYMPKAAWNSFLQEMQQMPLSDLAIILRQARVDIERSQGLPIKNKKRIGKLTGMADQIETLLAKKVFQEEFLYIVEDRRIRSATLNERDYKDCILAFYTPPLISEYIRKIPQKDIVDYLHIAFDLRGARGLIVHGVGVAAEKFIPKTDCPKMGQEKAIQIKNPDVVRIFTKLALLERTLSVVANDTQKNDTQNSHDENATDPQDAAAATTAEQSDEQLAQAQEAKKRRAEKIKALWEELQPFIAKAQFLVPVKKLEVQEAEDAAAASDGDPALKGFINAAIADKNSGVRIVHLKRGTEIGIPLLTATSDETRHAFPFFSDLFELYKLYPKEEYDAWVWAAESLLTANTDTLVLNAGSICYEITKDRLRFLLNEVDIALMLSETD